MLPFSTNLSEEKTIWKFFSCFCFFRIARSSMSFREWVLEKALEFWTLMYGRNWVQRCKKSLYWKAEIQRFEGIRVIKAVVRVKLVCRLDCKRLNCSTNELEVLWETSTHSYFFSLFSEWEFCLRNIWLNLVSLYCLFNCFSNLLLLRPSLLKGPLWSLSFFGLSLFKFLHFSLFNCYP